jgi:hypothetical protein
MTGLLHVQRGGYLDSHINTRKSQLSTTHRSRKFSIHLTGFHRLESIDSRLQHLKTTPVEDLHLHCFPCGAGHVLLPGQGLVEEAVIERFRWSKGVVTTTSDEREILKFTSRRIT